MADDAKVQTRARLRALACLVASLPEFWWWVLFTIVAGMALGAIDSRLADAFTIVTFLPGIAVTARRLHDTNRSGWLQLLVLIPIVGWILLIVWCVQERKVPNRFCGEALQDASV